MPDRLAEGRANMQAIIRDGLKMTSAQFADAYAHPFLLLAETGADVSNETGMRTVTGSQIPKSRGSEKRTAEDLLWAVTPYFEDSDPARITAGRSQDNDIVLSFTLVSKGHLAFEGAGDSWKLVDLGSSNGTELNGDRLQPNHPYTLQDGDVIDAAGEVSVTFMLPQSLHVVLPALGRILDA